MFLDQNSQAHLYGDFDPDALAYVQSFGPVKPTLKFNCRNTREIAFQTRAYTGADTGVATAGTGPEVVFAAVEDRERRLAALEKHLRSLARARGGPRTHHDRVAARRLGDLGRQGSARCSQGTTRATVARPRVGVARAAA